MSAGFPKAVRVTRTSDGQAYTGACTLMGVSAMGGTCFVYDGTGTTSTGFVAAVAQNGVAWFGPNGISCSTGLYVDLTTGPAVVYYTID